MTWDFPVPGGPLTTTKLLRFDSKITLCGPKELCKDVIDDSNLNYEEDLNKALKGQDVVMALRIQHERLASTLNISAKDYVTKFQLSHQKLMDAVGHDRFILLHPGPVNYGIELNNDVRDQEYCKINRQQINGVGIRMAILTKALLS